MWVYHDASEFILPVSTVVVGSLADTKLWFFVLEVRPVRVSSKVFAQWTTVDEAVGGYGHVPLLSELKEQFL